MQTIYYQYFSNKFSIYWILYRWHCFLFTYFLFFNINKKDLYINHTVLNNVESNV